LNAWTKAIEATGWAPALFVLIFIAASILILWRLEAMNEGGMEGTVLGTLVMPYCSGIGNLIFVFVIAKERGSGADVMTNALVNNVTNMTLLIGLPALIWGLHVIPETAGSRKKKRNNREHQVNRLSLLLSLSAVFVFTGAVWALGRDGRLDFNDGLVLIGLFLFWQLFHVFDVLKTHVRRNKPFTWMLPVNLALLGAGAVGTYVSIDWLVNWLSEIRSDRFISADNLGLLSGWLMVLPNALLALYYGWRGSPEIVYTSQVGDGHICIPLCVGIFALHRSFTLPDVFTSGVLLLLAATLLHMIVVTLFGRLPRFVGALLVGAYAAFIVQGFL